MNRFSRLLASVVTASFLLFPSLVLGHHSTSEYDQSVYVELEGEISKVFWKNPHVMLHMTTEENGKQVEWTLEGASVSSQARRGMTSDLINVGDRVRVAGFASRRRDHDMLAEHVLLPSGQEILLRGSRAPRWSDAQLVAFTTEGPDAAAVAQAQATADGLFRVWSWGRLQPGWWFFGGTDKFPLTDAALEKHQSWNEYEDNLQLDCVAPGMPNTMGNPYPIEFVRVGENIQMNAEEFDVKRTIHMNAQPDPSQPSSHLGYSVGHWQDDNTLVVSTSNINYPYFNRVGVSQSDQIQVEERFHVDADKGELNYELRVTDPWALTEPYQWKALWVWKPGEVVSVYGCEVES